MASSTLSAGEFTAAEERLLVEVLFLERRKQRLQEAVYAAYRRAKGAKSRFFIRLWVRRSFAAEHRYFEARAAYQAAAKGIPRELREHLWRSHIALPIEFVTMEAEPTPSATGGGSPHARTRPTNDQMGELGFHYP